MKRFIVALCVLATIPCASACRVPTTIVTPAGKAAYQAEQVVIRLSEISSAIRAGVGKGPGEIDVSDAFQIIEWISGDVNHRDPSTGRIVPTTGLVQAIQANAGQGWKAAAKLTWQTRIRVIFQIYPAIAPYVDVIDALLEVI